MENNIINSDLSNELDSLFLDTALCSVSPEDFVNKAREIKNIPQELSDFFQENYGEINGKMLGIFEAAKNYLIDKMEDNWQKIQSLEAFRYYLHHVKDPWDQVTESEIEKLKELQKNNK